MKTTALWSIMLWFAMACEQTRPDLLPTGSVVVPCAVGCVVWLHSGSGMVIAGLALLLRWILSAAGPPIEVFAVMLLSARIATTKQSSSRYDGGYARWWQPTTIVVIGELLLTAVGTSVNSSAGAFAAVVPRLLVAVPCIVAILFLLRLSEELGFRRTVSI